jgi:hypothetical protein
MIDGPTVAPRYALTPISLIACILGATLLLAGLTGPAQAREVTDSAGAPRHHP